MKLNLQLSCYNGARYLPYLFRSLAAQTYRDWRLYVLDNASRPEEASLIDKAVKESGLPISFFKVEKNIGFAGAHNFLFAKQAQPGSLGAGNEQGSDFVQLLNDDAFLEPDYLERVLKYLESNPDCAAACGKIFRWNFDSRDDQAGGRTKIVDSLGLVAGWDGSVRDLGSGESIESLPTAQNIGRVFGISGCLPMYRVESVKKVSPDGNLFDGSYVSYKEDVDLAYRLNAAGYFAAVVDQATAYHRRSYTAGQRVNQPMEVKYQSYRNHLWLLLTHLSAKSLLTDRSGVIPYEMAKMFYWLFKHPGFVKTALSETIRAWPQIKSKRAFIRRLGFK